MSDAVFTFDRYGSFLERLRSEGFEFSSYADDLGPGDVLLRHDVDLSPALAVEMARIEAGLDIKATYFFLLSTPLYNLFHYPIRESIHEIAALGHEVGVHFSTHQYWDAAAPPDPSALTREVRREREVLSEIAPAVTSTVSFHVPPSWVLKRRFDGFRSTYEPRFFEAIQYHADSGQRWRESAIPVPDQETPAQILTHPGLWGQRDRSFTECVERAVAAADERAEDYASSRFLESTSGRVGRSMVESLEP